MARLLQPDEVVRLDPDDHWNKINCVGFKWHLFKRNPTDGMIHKTICSIVLEHAVVDVQSFAEVRAADLCGYCFKGQRVED